MKHHIFFLHEHQDDVKWFNQFSLQSFCQEDWILVPKNPGDWQEFTSPCCDLALVYLSLEQEWNSNFLNSLRQWAFNLPMVVILEVPTQTLIERALDLGIQDYLVKSQINEVVILQSIHYAIERFNNLKKQQDSERRFRAIFDQLFELIFLLTPEGKIIDINKTALKVLGIKHKNFVELPLWEALKNHFYPEVKEKLKGSIISASQGKSTRYEVDIKNLWGQMITLDLSIKPILDERNQPILLLAELRDICDQKFAELESLKALTKARELAELRAKFVTRVSHEFRTPMSTLLLSSELLEKYGNQWSEEKNQTHRNRIKLAIKRMTELLEDILLTGQTEAGQVEFKPSLINLSLLCQKIIAKFQEQEGFNHQFMFINPRPIPDVNIDEDMLKVILNQLLTNAVRYSPKGAIIKLEIFQDNQQIILKVQDQGIGIPEPEQKQIFEKFYRGSNVGSISGTGLGLSLVKRFVEAHRGRIIIESQLGVGTEFTVQLPLDKNPSNLL